MPSVSKKQRFFKEVLNAKRTGQGSKEAVGVAKSMTEPDIEDFINEKAELKIKKAVLQTIKDCREPTMLNEQEEDSEGVESVSTTFHVKEDWSNYIKPYVGQPFSPKELEALNNFEKKESLKITRTEIWCKSSDSFSISKTTLIKKMMDGGQFSYNSFQKQEKPKSPEEQEQEKQKQAMSAVAAGAEGGIDNGLGGGLGRPMPPADPLSGIPSPQPSPMGSGNPEETPSTSGGEETPEEKEKEKEDIIVTKSVLFKDDIKGAAILIEFLKKLNL